MNYLHIIVFCISAISIFLAARNNIYTWGTMGVVNSLVVLLLFQNQLYVDASIQLLQFVLLAIGWWRWYQLAHVPRITHSSVKELAWMILAAILVTLTENTLLYSYTEIYLSIEEFCLLSLSTVAQLLLIQRRLESWWFMLLSCIVAIVTCFRLGLVVETVFTIMYGSLSFYGWYYWRNLMRD